MISLAEDQLDRWQEWIARNSLRGVSDGELESAMKANGFDLSQAQTLLHQVKASPLFRGALPLAWRTRNLESLHEVQLALQSQSVFASGVERRSNLSRQEFHEEYYVRNRPVVITDFMTDWPALRRWTPQYFKEVIGDLLVEIQAARKPEPVYEVFLKGHTTTMKMSEYIELITKSGHTNEYYLTANDRLLERPGVEPILNDFWSSPEYFDVEDTMRKQFLWFGPEGAVSPLHRDRLNVFMTQVYGHKRVKLISSLALHRVYNYESFFSEVDCEKPDYERFPLFKDLTVIDVELSPGEALLIPVGWWHHVRSLDISINLSFTNFVFPNDFETIYGV